VAKIKIAKDVDELLAMQDRAIKALEQAALALQIALQVLQDSKNEKGDQQKMVFVPVPTQVPTPVPTPGPMPVPMPYISPSIPGVEDWGAYQSWINGATVPGKGPYVPNGTFNNGGLVTYGSNALNDIGTYASLGQLSATYTGMAGDIVSAGLKNVSNALAEWGDNQE
jgi:hypothetical protein